MDEHLRAVDDALVRLRRLWSTHPRQVLEDGNRMAEMSTVLVVEACARGAEAGAEVSVGDVATFADVEHSTASRLTDRAVRAGFVARTPSAHDARRAALVLTADGRALRRRSVTFRTDWLARTLDGWEDGDVADLARLLGRLAAAVATHGGPGAPDDGRQVDGPC